MKQPRKAKFKVGQVVAVREPGGGYFRFGKIVKAMPPYVEYVPWKHGNFWLYQLDRAAIGNCEPEYRLRPLTRREKGASDGKST